MIEINKTDEEAAKELLNEIPEDYQKTVGFFAWDFCLAVAKGALSYIYSILKYIVGLGKFDNWELEDLKVLFSNLRNINYKEAKASSGELTVTSGSGMISEGALFETESGLQFKAVETKTVATNDNFMVECLTVGSVGNVPIDNIKKIPVTIAGVVSVTNTEAFANGYDEEGKPEYIKRFLDDVRKPITSGNKNHYIKWALECSGVGAAKVKSLWNGNNTVKVVIINSNFDCAADELLQAVQDYIDPLTPQWGGGNGQAPIGAYCNVVSADSKIMNVCANVEFKSGISEAGGKAKIENAIKDYFKSITFKENTVSYAKIGACILSVDDVLDYSDLTVNDAVDNVVLCDTNLSTEIPLLNFSVTKNSEE